MGIQAFSHVAVCISDLERSLAFYRDVLGFRERSRLDVSGEGPEALLGLQGVDLQAVYLVRDGVCVELLHYLSPDVRGSGDPRPMNALGLTHLSLLVDDLDGMLEELDRAGVRILRATHMRNEAIGAAAVFVTDPDGTRIELVQAPASMLGG